jgi:DNA replicative helicase MCM subunit Mcm2 (Cdc46/Mcm family)
MALLKHTCDNCDSVFTIKYDEENTESDPSFCPFCAEMIVDVDKIDEDDE